jgi:ketosteroid isomerase-like protein
MSEQENIRLIQEFFNAFGRAVTVNAVLSFYAEDFVLRHPMPEAAWPGAR